MLIGQDCGRLEAELDCSFLIYEVSRLASECSPRLASPRLGSSNEEFPLMRNFVRNAIKSWSSGFINPVSVA